MKINDIIYQTPEITEEKLLEKIDNYLKLFRDRNLIKRIKELHKNSEINKAFLEEYDLIQDRKSYLTKSQRVMVTGFVGMCMIQMVKDNGGGESTSSN